ncbi:MAG: nascent polypeptide-associated complex protein [Nanoarchaeota archaeon]|nr:nascent polypeptide-associated complex protein [Nanoarchaeota archaeon]
MIPGVNPKQLKAMMRQMGMSQDSLDATQVIIKTSSSTYVFDNPQVEKITMQGQTSFQIQGEFREVEEQVEVTISQDDIDMVKEQAQVSEQKAKEALEKANGDIAQAILDLTE